MERLITDVTRVTGMEGSVAKAAIGEVLWFLRQEAPEGHVAEFIDKMPDAREAVDAADARGDAGVTVAIEGMRSFMGSGRADTNILVGRLTNLGVKAEQVLPLVEEIVKRAKCELGAEGAAKIRSLLPAIDERLGRATPPVAIPRDPEAMRHGHEDPIHREPMKRSA